MGINEQETQEMQETSDILEVETIEAMKVVEGTEAAGAVETRETVETVETLEKTETRETVETVDTVEANETITPAFPDVEGLVGVGVDIVDIEHMRRILKRTPSFARKVFSADEQAYCDSMTDPASHYALRFAAKEAVLKALGTGFFEDGIGIRDIEVHRSDKGAPSVRLSGAAKARAEALGVREIPLSLSYTHQEAVAFAMSITNESIRVKEQRRDPKAELAQKFKQARGMLDEL